MKRTFNLLIVSGIAILLTSCLTVHSRLEHKSVPDIKRILVVTKTRMPQPSYAPSFLKAFPVNYDVCTVSLDGLSFNTNDVQEEALRCKSDVILSVETVYAGNMVAFTPNGMGMSQFNVEMRSATTNKPFWKAIVSAHPALGEEIPPRSIVRRLLNDGILEGKLPQTDKSSAVASSN